jgi:hypothetical protein
VQQEAELDTKSIHHWVEGGKKLFPLPELGERVRVRGFKRRTLTPALSRKRAREIGDRLLLISNSIANLQSEI